MTTIDSDSRDIIRAIETNDGEATTTEIRRRTGLKNSRVRYRYRKLEELDLIVTEHDPDATPDGVAPVTVARLTDKAREEIQKGLTVESKRQQANVEPVDNADDIKDLEEEINELHDLVETLQDNINWLGPRVESMWERYQE